MVDGRLKPKRDKSTYLENSRQKHELEIKSPARMLGRIIFNVAGKQSFCVNHSRKWIPDEN